MKKNLIVLLVSSLALCSCEGFLDMTPTDRVSPKIIWATTEKAEYNKKKKKIQNLVYK